MNHEKQLSRQRRARRARAKIRELRAYRLCVHRTPRHIYAQIIAPEGGRVLFTATSLGAEKTGNIASAQQIGREIAEKAKAAGITKVAFDRSGFKYHGRVKALAEAAREGGLEF